MATLGKIALRNPAVKATWSAWCGAGCNCNDAFVCNPAMQPGLFWLPEPSTRVQWSRDTQSHGWSLTWNCSLLQCPSASPNITSAPDSGPAPNHRLISLLSCTSGESCCNFWSDCTRWAESSLAAQNTDLNTLHCCLWFIPFNSNLPHTARAAFSST